MNNTNLKLAIHHSHQLENNCCINCDSHVFDLAFKTQSCTEIIDQKNMEKVLSNSNELIESHYNFIKHIRTIKRDSV